MIAAPAGLFRGHDAFRTVHVGALVLCALLLPWSKAGTSMAQMLLAANWIIEGIIRKDLAPRIRRAFTSAPSLVFIGFLLLHGIGLLWTSDLKWGLDLVRILFPVLVFAVVLGSSPRLSAMEFRAILLAGAWSVVLSTVACLALREGDSADYRALSVFISHIRLTLLLCLAIVVFLLDRGGGLLLRRAGQAAAIWALLFIDRLGSLQGYFILALLASVFMWRWAGEQRPLLRLGLRAMLLLLPMVATFTLWSGLRARYRLPDPSIAQRFERTAGGEYYQHDIHNPQMENGHHVWTYVALGELERGWERRSSRSLDGSDDRGHPIWSTLVRYMASKGLRKDSVGLGLLSDADIAAVERGQPTAHPPRWGGLSERLDEVVFELQQYHALGAAEGHSVAMRIEYLKAGWAIAKGHWWGGVGTGDTQRAFDLQYEVMHTRLSGEWRHRAHNQYLTLWISFGVFGLCWCLFSWWWPAWRTGAWREPLFMAWALIFGVSCLTDDTLETQMGATFFALYYTLCVFAAPSSPPRKPLQ